MRHAAIEMNTGCGILFRAMAIFLILSCGHAFAKSSKSRVAIITTKRIKPYEALSKSIVRNLGSKQTVKEFGLGDSSADKKADKELKKFGPDLMVSIGRKAYEFCSSSGRSVPIVSVYNTNLLAKLNPFSALQYLQPDLKKVTVVFDTDISDAQSKSLSASAEEFGLKLSVTKPNPITWCELAEARGAIIASEGILIINASAASAVCGDGPIVAVVDGGIEMYKELKKLCIAGLPKIDEIIDIGSAGEDEKLVGKLAAIKPGLVLCIGVNSYQRCMGSGGGWPVLAATRTEAVGDNVDRWADVGGVSMFIEPKDQVDALKGLVTSDVTLGVPFNPANSEVLILKAVLQKQSGITLVPMPASDSGQASKLVSKAFDRFNGVWVIPDKTLSVAPIQKLLLEESLKQKKILVTMMHPYTKRGAAMSVSGVGKDSGALCKRVAELIAGQLDGSNKAGKIVSSPASISLNVRTIEKLKLKAPEALLDSAEDVYGK